MEVILAVVVGVVYAAGLYLMLRRTLAQVIVGLGLLTNATNLLVFTSAGVTRGGVPLIPADAETPPPGAADPVVQALVLTAIVIGFGVIAFFIVLSYVTFRTTGTDELDELTLTDELRYGEEEGEEEAVEVSAGPSAGATDEATPARAAG